MIWTTAKRWISVRRQGGVTGTALESFKNSKLKSLVRYAHSKVPFYRDLFDRVGFEPEAFRGLADLEHLPIVNREDILDTPLEDLVSDDIALADCILTRTGGTSGKPITVCATHASREHETMVWARSWARNGLRPTDRQATVRDLEDCPGFDKIKSFQRCGLFRIQYLNIYDPPEDLAREIATSQPDILRGPPSILQVIAQQPDAIHIRPRMLFTTSETLTSSARDLIETNVCAPVHDLYGATEAGCIAWQCPDSGSYIVNSDSVIVVVLNGDRPAAPGEIGDIIITNLFADAMPFIRYRLSDTCEAGRRSPSPDSTDVESIRRILGRTLNPFILPDGTQVSPYIFMPDDIAGVREFDVVQESPSLVRIRVVKGEGFSEHEMELDRRFVQEYVGSQCQIRIEYVDSIQPKQ